MSEAEPTGDAPETPTFRRTWLPQLVICLLLLGALYPWPSYSYYVLLRWLSCPLFVYLALRSADQRRNTPWAWIFGSLAVLYNPIFRVHGTRSLWTAANVATAIVVAASVFLLKRPQTRTQVR